MRFYERSKFKRYVAGIAFGAVLLLGIPYLEHRVGTAVPPPAPVGTMSLTVFDIGQGDAVLAQEHDRQILIDGGPDATVLEKLGQAMPAGDRTIELVVLTHPHADHLNGLVSVLDRYDVSRVLMTDVPNDTVVYDKWISMLAEKNIPIDYAANTKEEMVGGMTYDILNSETKNQIKGTDHPGNSGGFNDSSIVGMLHYGTKKFLLMGDATTVIEKQLVAADFDLHADFLKIGHHGSAYSTGEELLDAVRPSFAAISVGMKNTYGHPAWRVVRLLEKLAIPYFRTDQNGDIRALTDGDYLQVTPQRVP